MRLCSDVPSYNFRSPLKSRRLSLNHTYPLDRRTSLSHVSPVKFERSSLVSARKEETKSIPRSKRQDFYQTILSQKNSDNVSVSNTENEVDQIISSSPFKSFRMSVTTNPSNSTLETSHLSFDKNFNEPTVTQVDSNLTIENDKELPRAAMIYVHDNLGSTSNRNQNMTKPSKPKRQKNSRTKQEGGPKSKRLKMNEQCSEVTQSTSPVNECDKTSALKKKPSKSANVKQNKVQHQDSIDQKIPHQHVSSEGSNKNMKISSRNSGSRNMGRVKNDLAESMSVPSSTSECQSNSESKGFVYTNEESLNRRVKDQVHSAGSQISSVVELDEAIPLQSMKSSRLPDMPIWSSILSQFKT